MKKLLATQLIWFEAQNLTEAEKMLAKGVMKNATIYRFSRVKAHDFNRGMKPVLYICR